MPSSWLVTALLILAAVVGATPRSKGAWLESRLRAISGSGSPQLNTGRRRSGHAMTALDGETGTRQERATVPYGEHNAVSAARPTRGRLSRLPTSCGNFKLRLTPSMLKPIDHAEFFNHYREVDVGDASRYEIIRKIGKGQQGLVVAAIDKLTGKEVAIKKVSNFLGRQNATAVLKEVVLLGQLRGIEGTMQLENVLPTARHSFGTLSALYLVMERLDVSLHVILRETKAMELSIQKWLVFQMISSLKNLHAAGVVHQDISIWNIMAQRDCTIKLVDFGYAAPIKQVPPVMPYHAATISVPLPGNPGVAVPELDIWYMGMSILAITQGQYYFKEEGGRTEERLIAAWFAEYGEPPADLLALFTPEAKAALDLARKAESNPSLQSLFPDVHPEIISLCHRMMSWDIAQIPTAAELLLDPVFHEVHLAMGPSIVPEKFTAALMSKDRVKALDGTEFLSVIHNTTILS